MSIGKQTLIFIIVYCAILATAMLAIAVAYAADPPAQPNPAQTLLKARQMAHDARELADNSEWRAVQDFAQVQENDIQLLAGKVGWWQDCSSRAECWEWVKPK